MSIKIALLVLNSDIIDFIQKKFEGVLHVY